MGTHTVYLRHFPPHAKVFHEAEALEPYTFPLCSLALKRLNPLWEGFVTWVYTLEDPYNDDAAQHQNRLCVHGMRLSFTREKGLYRLATDVGFFAPGEAWRTTLDEVQKAYAYARENNSFSLYPPPLRLASKPRWTQGDETPRDPDGKKMIFLGQVYSGDYIESLACKDLFLFYAPDHALVTQVTQIT